MRSSLERQTCLLLRPLQNPPRVILTTEGRKNLAHTTSDEILRFAQNDTIAEAIFFVCRSSEEPGSTR